MGAGALPGGTGVLGASPMGGRASGAGRQRIVSIGWLGAAGRSAGREGAGRCGDGAGRVVGRAGVQASHTNKPQRKHQTSVFQLHIRKMAGEWVSKSKATHPLLSRVPLLQRCCAAWPQFRKRPYFCASTTAMATISTISRTEAPIWSTCTGFFRPVRMGPMISMPARLRMRL